MRRAVSKASIPRQPTGVTTLLVARTLPDGRLEELLVVAATALVAAAPPLGRAGSRSVTGTALPAACAYACALSRHISAAALFAA